MTEPTPGKLEPMSEEELKELEADSEKFPEGEVYRTLHAVTLRRLLLTIHRQRTSLRKARRLLAEAQSFFSDDALDQQIDYFLSRTGRL